MIISRCKLQGSIPSHLRGTRLFSAFPRWLQQSTELLYPVETETLPVTAQVIGEKGKGLIADRNFKKGEVIFFEAPIVGQQLACSEAFGYMDHAQRLCNNCFTPLQKPFEGLAELAQIFKVPGALQLQTQIDTYEAIFGETLQLRTSSVDCRQNCGLAYCSEACEETAWSCQHSLLCTSGSTDSSHPIHQLHEHISEQAGQLGNFLMHRVLAAMVLRLAAVKGDRPSGEPLVFEELELAFAPFAGVFRDSPMERWVSEQLLAGSKHTEDQLWDAGLEAYEPLLDVLKRLFSKSPAGVDFFAELTPLGYDLTFGMKHFNATNFAPTSVTAQYLMQLGTRIPDKDKGAFQQCMDMVDSVVETGAFDSLTCSGLFRLHSCINHACIPNCQNQAAFSVYPDYAAASWQAGIDPLTAQASQVYCGRDTFPFNELAIVASRPIQKGDELTLSYIDDLGSYSAEERRKMLMQTYGFECQCAACLAEVDVL